MKILKLRTVMVSLGLIFSLTFAMDGIGNTLKPSRPKPQSAESHASGLMARVTLLDGTNRTVTLEGFGCSAAICSRVFFEGRSNAGSAAKVWIDGLSAIRDITVDSAVFIMRDGKQQRLSLITDFRVSTCRKEALNHGNSIFQKFNRSRWCNLQNEDYFGCCSTDGGWQTGFIWNVANDSGRLRDQRSGTGGARLVLPGRILVKVSRTHT